MGGRNVKWDWTVTALADSEGFAGKTLFTKITLLSGYS